MCCVCYTSCWLLKYLWSWQVIPKIGRWHILAAGFLLFKKITADFSVSFFKLLYCILIHHICNPITLHFTLSVSPGEEKGANFLCQYFRKAQNKGKRKAAQDSASNTEGESSPEKAPSKPGSGKRAKTITVKKKGDAPFMKPVKGKGSPVKSPITQKQLKATRSKASSRSPGKSIRVNFKKASPLKRGRGRPVGRANSASSSPSVSSASSQSSSPKKSSVNGKKTGKSSQESAIATRKRAAEDTPESSPGKRSRTSDTSVESSPVKRRRGASDTGNRKVTRAELAKQSE